TVKITSLCGNAQALCVCEPVRSASSDPASSSTMPSISNAMSSVPPAGHWYVASWEWVNSTGTLPATFALVPPETSDSEPIIAPSLVARMLAMKTSDSSRVSRPPCGPVVSEHAERTRPRPTPNRMDRFIPSPSCVGVGDDPRPRIREAAQAGAAGVVDTTERLNGSGLAAGETTLVSGQPRVYNGDSVRRTWRTAPTGSTDQE